MHYSVSYIYPLHEIELTSRVLVVCNITRTKCKYVAIHLQWLDTNVTNDCGLAYFIQLNHIILCIIVHNGKYDII